MHPGRIMRLGFVTELLSKPIRYGYMNGIALTVLISQLPKLFGFSTDRVGPLRDLVKIAKSMLGGEVNWTAFAVGAVTLAVILLLTLQTRSGHPGCGGGCDNRVCVLSLTAKPE